MANISAHFAADFSDFVSAVQQAETKLRDIKSGSADVENALKRAADAFSGRRVLTEATLAVKAVTDLGGATKLTESEQRKLNATVTEALAKYQALGQEAPADMVALQKATQQTATATQAATTQTANWRTQLTSLAGAFGVTFSVAAVVQFGRELLNLGDQIQRVSDRTGLSTKEVQQFQYIAQQSGNSIDELTGAIGQMQNRLISGDKSAVAAVQALGLNLQSLIAASPADQMGQIAAAIAKVPDPATKAAIAMDVFGKTGIAILPTLTSNFNELANAAPVMSDATVKALDQAGDQLARFGTQIKVWAAESYLNLSSGFDKMTAAIMRFTADLIDAQNVVLDWASRVPGVASALDKLGISVKENAAQAQVLRDAATLLLNPLESTTAAATRLTPAMYETAEATSRAATAAAKAAAEADKQATAYRALNNQIAELEFKAIEEWQKQLAASATRAQQLQAATLGMGVALQRWTANVESADHALRGLTNEGLLPTNEALAEALQQTLLYGYTIRATAAEVERATGLFGALRDGLESIWQGMSKGQGLAGLFRNLGDSLIQGFGNLLSGGLTALINQGIGLAFEGLKKIGSLIKDIFDFGGPSKEEKEGRSVAAQFREELAAMLTAAQEAQAQAAAAAGANLDWARSTIAIRDAYLAVGKSEAEALAIADRLWKAEKLGGEAVRVVIEEIRRVLEQSTAAGKTFGEAVVTAAQAGQTAIAAMGTEFTAVAGILGAGIDIPLTFKTKVEVEGGIEALGGGGGGNRGGYLTPEEAREAGVPWRPKSDFDWSDAIYRTLRDEDISELNKLAEEAAGFQIGTQGRYQEFGRSSLVRLHGRERVSTEAEGRAEMAAWRAIVGEIAGLRRDLRKMDLWIRDGLIAAKAGA